MFGSARRSAALEARIAELEQRVRLLDGQLAAVGPLLTDAHRLEALATRAASAVSAQEPLGERAEAQLDTLYRAERTGFVAVYYVTDRTAWVRLLVGQQNPPTFCVGEAYCGYVGAVVRAGEWWIAKSSNKRSNRSFRVNFTPLA